MENNRVKISFKGVSTTDRRAIMDLLRSVGLTEISSYHDVSMDRHGHLLDSSDIDTSIIDNTEELFEIG